MARVRRVRERDSLTGLQQAVREAAQARSRVADLEARLAVGTGAGGQALDSFVVTRNGLLAVGECLTAARGILETSTNLASLAQAHWQRDKSRLKAIEMLQEHRAAEARAEMSRAEAKELDDIATQLWQRRRTERAVVA